MQETAVFHPALQTDEDGQVRIEVTMPEALTRWRLMGMAHDAELRSGMISGELVTDHELMVQPNPPRFVRQGEQLDFSVKVTNRSDEPQRGEARLTFRDAATQSSVDAALGLDGDAQPFDLAAGASTALHWTINVPDDMDTLIYKAVAATETVSDGEEGRLPVLSRRIQVHHGLPWTIQGPGSETMQLKQLAESAKSETLQTRSLQVEVTSNPTWYALLALPYLMEYPHECNEQLFNRLYANLLAQHTLEGAPRVAEVIERWGQQDAADRPQRMRKQLPAIASAPASQPGDSQADPLRQLGVLTDRWRMDKEINAAIDKLLRRRAADGSWSWFPGGGANGYITLYIMAGIGRLKHLGVEEAEHLTDNGPRVIDRWIQLRHQALIEAGKDLNQNHLDPLVCLALYARSFFMEDEYRGDDVQAAIDFYLDQAKHHWERLRNWQSLAHLAIALKRMGDEQEAEAIMVWLKDNAVV